MVCQIVPSDRQAEDILGKYMATFVRRAPENGQTEPEIEKEFRLRGTSFLLNYNWDFFGKNLPDGTPAPSDAADLWAMWLEWKSGKKKEMDVVRSTSTLEESLRSSLPGRVHFHWKV